MIRCELRNAATGKQIAWTAFSDTTNRWGWISRTIASQFNCWPDDVGVIETDDGDRITVRGEIVAYRVEP